MAKVLGKPARLAQSRRYEVGEVGPIRKETEVMASERREFPQEEEKSVKTGMSQAAELLGETYLLPPPPPPNFVPSSSPEEPSPIFSFPGEADCCIDIDQGMSTLVL